MRNWHGDGSLIIPTRGSLETFSYWRVRSPPNIGGFPTYKTHTGARTWAHLDTLWSFLLLGDWMVLCLTLENVFCLNFMKVCLQNMGSTEFLPVCIIAAKTQHYQYGVEIECEGEWKESLQIDNCDWLTLAKALKEKPYIWWCIRRSAVIHGGDTGMAVIHCSHWLRTIVS